MCQAPVFEPEKYSTGLSTWSSANQRRPRKTRRPRGVFLRGLLSWSIDLGIGDVPSTGPPRPGLVAHRGQRRRHLPSENGAVPQPGFNLQEAEPQDLVGAYLQAMHIWSKGPFDQHSGPFRGNFSETRCFSGIQVGSDRDLGGGTGSMVQTDQIKNGQSPSLPDVLQGIGRERDRYPGRPSLAVTDRLAEPEPLNVKPRRHAAPTLGRYPFLVPP